MEKLASDSAGLDERELLRRYHEDGDLVARDVLVERMLPLVRRLARRYANRGEALDDLEQVGSLGLIKAIDRFDVSRELKRRMAEAIEGGKTRIVVDLTDAAFMDSTALGVLISALKRLRLREGSLAIASDQPSILRILEVTGMDQVLIVRPTAEEALAALSEPPDAQG